MNLSHSLHPLHPAFAEAVYTVTGADPAAELDAEVSDGASVLATKRLHGADSYRVNIAYAVQGLLAVAPATSQECGIYTPEGRTARASLRIGTLTAPLQTFSASTAVLTGLQKLSDAPEIVPIRWGENDEIPFAAPEGRLSARITLGGNDTLAIDCPEVEGGSLHCFVLATDDLLWHIAGAGKKPADFARIEVALSLDGEAFLYQVYTIEEPCEGVRLAWLNPYGSVDYHTFPVVVKEEMAAGKSSVLTPAGYKTARAATTCTLTVTSDYEPTPTLRWLAQAASSPRAWIVAAGARMPVGIDAAKVTTRSEALARVELTLRCGTKRLQND